MPLWIVVLILGVIEGITEFLPISSTGHLVLADRYLGFHLLIGGDEQAAIFKVFIQSGALLAVGVAFFKKLLAAFTSPLHPGGRDYRLLINMIIGFVPVAVLGLLFYDVIESLLASPLIVAWALIVGGVIMLIIERLPIPITTERVEDVSHKQAAVIGFTQAISLFPGTSRAASTILGGMCAGLDRRTSTEFSFLLAFPVLFAASGYVLVRRLHLVNLEMIWVLLLGFFISFVAAYAVVIWLLRFVEHHRLDVFAYYRIALGIVIVLLLR